MRNFAEKFIPAIGRYQVFNQRSGHNSKINKLTIEDLVNEKTIYPTVVIPIGKDGSVNHAFCVVDDLIFDSTQTHALKLTSKSIDWICGASGSQEEPLAIYRFQQCTNKKKTKKRYKRKLSKNW